jgi:hypothetical protein
MIVISGIPPVLSIGGGRFMAQVEREARQIGPAIQLRYTGNKSQAAECWRRKQFGRFVLAAGCHYWRRLQRERLLHRADIMNAPDVVLVHCQEIGLRWCLQFITQRQQPTWIYLLDSSFFCVRSYNHIEGENQACLRCLGGDFTQGQERRCRPFPIRDRHCWRFLECLRHLAAEGRVRFLAQNRNQAALAQCHFGPAAVVREVGLWTVDMEEASLHPAHVAVTNPYDVVFHGAPEPAKGVEWALEVARLCPDLRFLFPLNGRRFARWSSCRNIVFQPMRWETGLKQQVVAAQFVFVPSLWSAPIEGALIKSLCLAKNVVVVDVPSAYAAELPAGLVLRLAADPVRAAAELLVARQQGVAIPESTRGPWREEFVRVQRGIVNRLLGAVRG